MEACLSSIEIRSSMRTIFLPCEHAEAIIHSESVRSERRRAHHSKPDFFLRQLRRTASESTGGGTWHRTAAGNDQRRLPASANPQHPHSRLESIDRQRF